MNDIIIICAMFVAACFSIAHLEERKRKTRRNHKAPDFSKRLCKGHSIYD